MTASDVSAPDAEPSGRSAGGASEERRAQESAGGDERKPSWWERFLDTVKSWGGLRHESLKEAVEGVLEEHEEDSAAPINPQDREMLHNILDFSECEVQDVMTQRTDIVAVPEDISLPELKAVILETEHTRMPVYGEDLDDVRGFIHIKDLVRYLGNGDGGGSFRIADILRELLAVPPSMKVSNLLVEMRHKGVHMALVVDEYGGTDGIVTLEDLFERIVGDIHDEHDEGEEGAEIQVLSANEALTDARVDIEEIEKAFNVTLASDEEDKNNFHTLGGFIFTKLGRVPETGEKLEHDHLRFEIVRADPRRIEQVRIVRKASV